MFERTRRRRHDLDQTSSTDGQHRLERTSKEPSLLRASIGRQVDFHPDCLG